MKFLFIPILFISTVFAQELVPLKNELDLNFNSKSSQYFKRGTMGIDTLTLPFKEEFSTSALAPNSTFFQDSGGSYINNRYCVNPPTLNVASFDGLNYSGQPYSQSNEFDRGKCDELISNAINLDGKSNVYMSFWWQAQGNAVPQVSSDSIHLMFYNNDSTWNLVWAETGQLLNDFQFVNLKIDSSYLHSGFQFKFENFGNKSGMFGVWHIDYIYIDDNRNQNDSIINDIAFSNTPSSFLKKYWVMPKSHFQESDINDSIITSLNNFKNDGSGLNYIIQTNGFCEDVEANNSISIHNNPTNSIAPYEFQKEVLGSNLNATFLSSNNEIVVKNKFIVVSNDQSVGDTVDGKIVDFNTKENDSISSYTTFADYYAYDDGSAEQAFRITTQDGLVMQEFEISTEDTLYGISVYFPGNVFQYDSNQIVWMVWDSIASGDSYDADNILYDERALIGVADSLNGFTRYNFLEPVIVKDKFYIGYRQDDDYDILIGYDINSSPGFEPIYFNTNGNWQRFQLNEGVLMLRPHFKPFQFTNIEQKIEELSVNMYPNPTRNILNFSLNIDEINIYDLNGRLVKSSTQKTNTIDLTELRSGMYFITLQAENKKKRTKFIKH